MDELIKTVKAGVVRTFYVVRLRGHGFTAFVFGGTDTSSDSRKKVDDVDQFPSVIAAAQKIGARNSYQKKVLPDNRFEIVRVDRETIPGSTVRRVVKEDEVVPTNAKWALKSNHNGFLGCGFYNDSKGWYNEVATADVFTTQEEALQAFGKDSLKRGYAADCIRLVRVVEETLPGTTKDTLTVVA